MKEKIIRITGYLRFFTLEVLKESEIENVSDLLRRHLEKIEVYDEDSEDIRCLYFYRDNTYWLPAQMLQEIVATLRILYPDRESYELINTSPYTPDTMDISMKPEFKLRDYQQQYHDIITEDGRKTIFVDLRTGSGKASWVESKVLTKKGWKKLKDIVVGEELVSIDERRNRVEAIYPQGVKQLYKITTDNGRTHVCCKEHLWEVMIHDAFSVMQLEDIMQVYKHTEVSLPYLIPLGGVKMNYHDSGMEKFFELLMDDFTLGGLTEENRLDSLIANVNLENRLELVNQLLIHIAEEENREYVTNITTGNGYCMFTLESTNNNLNFFDAVKTLILSLDGYVHTEVDTTTLRVKMTCAIYGLDFNMLSNVAYQNAGSIAYTRIVKIEKFKEDEAICLKVSHPDSLYVVDDYLITHNTVIATNAVCTMGKKVGVFILPRYIDKWVEDFSKYTDIDPERVFVVQGSDSIKKVLEDHDKYDVFIFSSRTMMFYFKKFSDGLDVECRPDELFSKLGIGVLLSDESHQELKTIFMGLVYNNVPKLVGMSATLVSDKKDEKYLQELLFPKEVRVSNLVKFDNHIEFVQAPYYLNIGGLKFRYQSHLGYSQIEFEKSIMKYKLLAKSYYEMIWYRIETDYLERRKKGEKAIIFFGLVGMCQAFKEFLEKKEELRKKKIRVCKYTQGDPFSNILEYDIIVSTRKSLGTAIDVPKLISVYDTILERSVKGNLQAIGRLRRLEESRTIYYNIYAKNLLPHNAIAKARMNQCKAVYKRVTFSDYGEVSRDV